MSNDYRLQGTTYGVFYLITIFIRMSSSVMTLSLFMITDVITRDIAFAGNVGAISAVGGVVGQLLVVKLYRILGITQTMLASVFFFIIGGIYVYRGWTEGSHVMTLLGAAGYGLCYPSCNTVIRYILSQFISAGKQRDKAFTLDALSTDIGYTFAPSIAAFLVNSAFPKSAHITAMVVISLLTVAFVSLKPVRMINTVSTDEPERKHKVPPLLWKIILSQFFFLAAVGSAELMVQDAGKLAGRGQWVGFILGIWSVTSVIGGLILERKLSHGKNNAKKLRNYGLLFAGAGVPFIPTILLENINFLGLRFSLLGGLFLLSGVAFAYNIGLGTSLLDDIFPIQTPAVYFAYLSVAPTLGYALGLTLGGQIGKYWGPYASLTVSGLSITALSLWFLWINRSLSQYPKAQVI